MAICVILYFAFIGYRFLPDRKDLQVQFEETIREFVIEMTVDKAYPYLGKSIEEGHLRHLKGLYLFQIMRGEEEITPVAPEEKILLNDRLFFAGLPETIYEIQRTPGLHISKDGEFDLKNIDSDKLKTYEVVVSNTSSLVGQTVRESEFRAKYGAVILGVHRSGKRIRNKIGDIVLDANDTLFLLAKKDFDTKWYHSTEFSLVSLSVDRYSKPKVKGMLALLLTVCMILSVVLGLTSMLISATVTACIMFFLGIISIQDAQKGVDLDLLVVIASALGIGEAIGRSGLAELIAHGLIQHLEGVGIVGMIWGLFFITSVYTELITNNAAAAVMFPIALSVATQLNLDPKPFVLVITISASCCFATPIGYQTNMMVYNAGGYKFTDFLKVGIPLNLLVGGLVTLLTWVILF